MQITDKVIVVTGGGNGIGRALCRRFAADGARAIVVADLNGDAARRVADEVHGTAVEGDVSREADIQRAVREALDRHGRHRSVLLECGHRAERRRACAGREWSACWNVHVMAHVYAARAVLPHMLERGEGYLLQTVSAAGLLTHPQSATYAVTKHASLAFAEWLSIAYGDRGIKVSALCPQGVRTDMLMRAERAGSTFLMDTAVTPEQVADDVVKGIDEERFLILPHPEVAEYVRRRATDHERWLRGMRRLRKSEV
jgi:NAD(P)-dependent dehydrogenase (short-subunit alcohol dehydrogenase family)